MLVLGAELKSFIDDLTILEMVNLLITGVCSYNIKSHIPSDLPIHRAATFDKLLGRTWAGPGQDKSKTGQDKQDFWKLDRTF